MARLSRLLTAVLVLSLLPTPIAESAVTPTRNGGLTGQFEDSAAVVGGGVLRPETEPQEQISNGKRVKYAAVCAARLDGQALSQSDVCHHASSLCNLKQSAYWRSTSTPGSNVWTRDAAPVCLTNAEAGEAGVPVLTAEQFRRLPIPVPKLEIQPDPAKGSTLINIATNFYTDGTPADLNTTVLGLPVKVRATPSAFDWTYGDGTRVTLTGAGGPYPDLSGGHTYTQPGTYEVALKTIFEGQYSVDGGPWQPVAGTATVASDPRKVTAKQARSQLTR